MMAGVWIVVGSAAAGHFFWLANRFGATDRTATVVTAGYFGLTLVLLVPAGYFAVLRRRAGDARVLVDTDHFRPGGRFKVRVEQTASRELRVEELKIGLVCDATTRNPYGRRTRIGTAARYDDWGTAVSDQAVAAGNQLFAEQTLTIPAKEPPTSPADQREYPRYDWRISVHTRLANGPDFRGDYPLPVTDGGSPRGRGRGRR